MTWHLLAVVAAAVAGFAIGVAVRRRQVVARETTVTVPHRARVILKALPHAVLIVDSSWLIEFANSEAVELGLALPDGRLPPSLRELASRAIDRDGSTEGAVKIPRRGTRDAQFHVFARALPGESRAVLAVFDADAPMASRIAQREFIVNVSHELKTPVGAIALIAEALQDSADDPEAVRKFAASISRENSRLALLVEQFIELSRLQSSHTVITTVETDLRKCIADAVEAVSEYAQRRGVRVEIDGVPAITVKCEPRSFTSAVRNLIDNAVRYSSDQTRVVVTAQEVGDDIEVKVVDQGIGIDPLDVPRIFDRFFRADGARDRESGGTGIGLAIVKHVARQHGGRVDVWSEPGVGSTFTIVIPRTADRGEKS